jgi:hypothetical protein
LRAGDDDAAAEDEAGHAVDAGFLALLASPSMRSTSASLACSRRTKSAFMPHSAAASAALPTE